MKYIIYCRKSSEDDTKQIQSLETQEALLDEYAQKANLIVVDRLHESRSAKNDNNRPLFNLMMEKIENDEAHAILVAHIDRLSRNGTESAKIMKLFEQGALKEIRTPSRIYSSIQDLLYMDFDFVFAAHYSRNLSIRVKEGLQTKLNKGEFPSKAPLGYLNKEGKIYPDPQYAPFIVKTFELYVTGNYSLKQLVEHNYNQGLRSATGGKIRKSTFDRMLKNPVYMGFVKSNNKLYKGIHTPLISEELFEASQNINKVKARPKPQIHQFLYRGFVHCACCGCMYTTSLKKGKYIYYYCTNGRLKCTQHKEYMRDFEIQNLAQSIFNKINKTITSELAQLSLEAYCNDLKDSSKFQETSLQTIESNIKKSNQKQQKLLDLLLDEKITQETYDHKLMLIKEDEKVFHKQKRNIHNLNPENTMELLHSFKDEAISLSDMFSEGDDEVRLDLLNSALWNFSIEDKKIALVRFKVMYEKLANCSKTNDFATWLPDRDSNPNSQLQRLLSYH
jgi:site-specific DNA recombinase